MDSTMDQGEQLKAPVEDIGLTATFDTTKRQAHEVASSVSDEAQRATAAAGETLHSLAGTIRDRAPEKGSVAMVAGRVAENFQGAGTYLQERGIPGAVDDLTVLIRRYPLQSIIIAVGLGFLLARQRR